MTKLNPINFIIAEMIIDPITKKIDVAK